jgi:hypothetical protein
VLCFWIIFISLTLPIIGPVATADVEEKILISQDDNTGFNGVRNKKGTANFLPLH